MLISGRNPQQFLKAFNKNLQEVIYMTTFFYCLPNAIKVCSDSQTNFLPISFGKKSKADEIGGK
jgi:hypothetical protein